MRVLLVEDDNDLANGLKQALLQDGYTVDWIVNGSVADRLLHTEHFDLVVLAELNATPFGWPGSIKATT